MQQDSPGCFVLKNLVRLAYSLKSILEENTCTKHITYTPTLLFFTPPGYHAGPRKGNKTWGPGWITTYVTGRGRVCLLLPNASAVCNIYYIKTFLGPEDGSYVYSRISDKMKKTRSTTCCIKWWPLRRSRLHAHLRGTTLLIRGVVFWQCRAKFFGIVVSIPGSYNLVQKKTERLVFVWNGI